MWISDEWYFSLRRPLSCPRSWRWPAARKHGVIGDAYVNSQRVWLLFLLTCHSLVIRWSFLTGIVWISRGHVVIFLLCKHCILGRVTESSGGQLRGWGNLKWAFDLVWGCLWPGIHQANLPQGPCLTGTSEVSTYANITHSMSALKSCSCTPLLSWMAKEKHHSFLPAPFANILANNMRVIF